MAEVWKDVIGYEGYYQVSNLGRVKRIKQGKSTRIGRILNGFLNKSNYYQVQLTVNGKSVYPYVHRLVAEAFLPNDENKPQVNHINGIKTDNRVENLEWVTCSENVQHAYRTGLHIITEETRQKVSESLTGRHLTEEHRINIGKASRGRYHTEATKKKMSESKLGKHPSEETRRKISETLKGRSNSLRGRIRVNNGTENRMVKPDDLQAYLNNGYELGICR